VTLPRIPLARVFAYVGFFAALGLTLWANYTHTFIPPVPDGTRPAAWYAQLGDTRLDPPALKVAWALFLPFIVFVLVEVLIRTDWTDVAHARYIQVGGIGPVLLVAGFSSYRHMASLLELYGEHHLVHTVGPLGVDGAMILLAVVLHATSPKHRTAPAVPAAQPVPAPVVQAPPVQVVQPAPVQPVPVQVVHPVAQPDRTTPDHPGTDEADQPDRTTSEPEPVPGGTDQADPMAQALADVLADRLSIRAAAAQYSVRRATLADKVKAARPDPAPALTTVPFSLPAVAAQQDTTPKNGHHVAATN
jgi:hypothetical protein